MNDSSSPSTPCPRCGAALPPNAPEGLCPRCLAALPLGTETAFGGEAKGPAHSPLPPEELAPHFPQLEILECLGRGGMGVVYKARQKSLNRPVALKLLAPERADDPQFAARFEKEAQALAALNHPNIVAVHDFGRAGGFYYLLMEFVDGVNLRQLLQSRRLTPKEALGIVPPVCDALQFAHEHGIVHRDIKPENLLLDKAGHVKIADFGIAKIIAASPGEAGSVERRTSPGTATLTAGTPAYAAPEQREAHGEADHRADIYSLGVVLYEMLTGERPQARFELPSRRVQVDVRIDDIVLRALQDTPERRYQTAAEFRTQVESIRQAASEPGEATAEGAVLRAVHAWLELFDRGEYASTWDTASTWFHNAVTKESWITNVQGVRPPLGTLLSREVLDTRFVAGGSQFQVRFKTGFTGLPEAVETVNFMREPDGTWKGTGYLIRPADYEDLRHRRLAAIGAWWALLVPVAAVMIFLLRSQSMGRPVPAFLALLFAPFLVAGISAPVGTTVLGWMATAHLRRSTKRQGLWLAVFDGLLFPLLALDLAIGATWFTIVGLLTSLLNFPTPDLRALDHLLVAVWVMLSVVTSALADWHIARRVWRTVSREAGPLPKRATFDGNDLPWFTGGAILTALLMWAFLTRESPRISPIATEKALIAPPAAAGAPSVDRATGAALMPPSIATRLTPPVTATPTSPAGIGTPSPNPDRLPPPTIEGTPVAPLSDPIHEADMRVLRAQYEKTLNELYEAQKDLALSATQAEGSTEERLKKADMLTQKVRLLEDRCAELRKQIQSQNN